MTRLRLACALILVTAAPAAAQNSVYAVRGAGFPGRPVSVRARAMGGGYGMFDRMSAVNPATVAALSQLRASATYGTTFRGYDAGATSVRGLVETRFPMALIGGGMGRSPFSFALSYGTYAERSFDITTTSTVQVSGTDVDVEDRLASVGGIVDVRGALGWRISPDVQLGVGLHLINGSSQVRAERVFTGGGLRSYSEQSDLSFSGVGVSGGLIARAARGRMVLGVTGRYDSDLTSRIDDRTSSDTHLPISLEAGMMMSITSRLTWASAGTWRSWGGSASAGTFAFDTWEVASGFEITGGLAKLPLRIGGRYGTLPFSPISTQPHEWGLSGGTGFIFAQGRGELDFSVERLMRDGGGATERGWHFSVGIVVQP